MVWDSLLRCCGGEQGVAEDVMEDADAGVQSPDKKQIVRCAAENTPRAESEGTWLSWVVDWTSGVKAAPSN